MLHLFLLRRPDADELDAETGQGRLRGRARASGGVRQGHARDERPEVAAQPEVGWRLVVKSQ